MKPAKAKAAKGKLGDLAPKKDPKGGVTEYGRTDAGIRAPGRPKAPKQGYNLGDTGTHEVGH